MTETMASRLKEARISSGYSTASAAAKAMNLPLGTYIGHENGSRDLTLASSKRYANAFDVSAAWLLTGEGDKATRLLSDSADKFLIRLPDGLREQLKVAAKSNNRSMNSEIVARLSGNADDRRDRFVAAAMTGLLASGTAKPTGLIDLAMLAETIAESMLAVRPR